MTTCTMQRKRWSGGTRWHDNSAPVSHARIMRPAARPAKRAEMDAAATFRSAVSDLEAAIGQQRRARPELAFENQPPPRRLAPLAAAIGATLHEPDLDPGARGRAPPPPGGAADPPVRWGSVVPLYCPGRPTRVAGA